MVVLLCCAVALSRSAFGAALERVSVSSSGAQADAECLEVAVSADGRFVAFSSTASNLIENDANDNWDVFVRDRVTGTTERVSVTHEGEEAKGASGRPAISRDGRFVVFVSDAANLVPEDTNESQDVFVRDRAEGRTELVSVSSSGRRGDGDSGWYPSISGDGRFVVFVSSATTLTEGDENSRTDVFLRDRVDGTAELVSVSSEGEQGKSASGWMPAISADGRVVVFASQAVNLVAGDGNDCGDVFARDRCDAKTERLTVSSDGVEATGSSGFPRVSADGRFVAFISEAPDLTAEDTNEKQDVFVRDRAAGTTFRVSLGAEGAQADGDSGYCAMSACGRWVAFHSAASNLTAEDENGKLDVFLRDRDEGTTTLVSAAAAGESANGDSMGPAISADGRCVVFVSDAANLVKDDTNGVRDVFVWARPGD